MKNLTAVFVMKTLHSVSPFSMNNRELRLRNMESPSKCLFSSCKNDEFNPFGLSEDLVTKVNLPSPKSVALGVSSFLTTSAFHNEAFAVNLGNTKSFRDFNPDTFRPVCPASDVFYGLLKESVSIFVGEENFDKFGPLIAEGLLRIRLELCVVESYFNEAVGPFIQKNGLNWVLPLHETIETFVAGVIFAVATAFISVSSTKIITVIFTYTDFLIGVPLRVVGGFAFDRARGKPIIVDFGIGPWKTRVLGPKDDNTKNEEVEKFDISKLDDIAKAPFVILFGGTKYLGDTLGILRTFMEAIDLFFGRYLILIATGYIGIKFLHFKIFPDFP